MEPIDVNETVPLLAEERPAAHEPSIKRSWKLRLQVTSPWSITVVTYFSLFFLVLSGTLAMVPSTRLAEDIFCRIYFGEDAEIDEEKCKAQEVQSHTAYLIGVTAMAYGIIGLIAAVPFGILADRGRKRVFFLAMTGQSLHVVWAVWILRFWPHVPIQLIWAGPFFQLIGGGVMVAPTVLYAMLNDVQTDETRATAFFYFSLAAQAAVFVGPPLASKMMELWSPWAPMILVMLLGPASGLVVLLIPETLHLQPNKANAENTTAESDKGLFSSIRSLGPVLRNSSMLLLIFASLLKSPVAAAMTTTFLQYFSNRYGRTLADAGYFLSIRGGIVLVVTGVLLPGASAIMTNPSMRIRWSGSRKDLILAQISGVTLLLGMLLVAGPTIGSVVAGLVISSIGAGIGPLIHALIAGRVDPSLTSRLFTLINLLEAVTTLPTGPILAWTLTTGMRLGGALQGLPFLFLALLSFLMTAALFLVKNSDARNNGLEDAEEATVHDLDREHDPDDVLD